MLPFGEPLFEVKLYLQASGVIQLVLMNLYSFVSCLMKIYIIHNLHTHYTICYFCLISIHFEVFFCWIYFKVRLLLLFEWLKWMYEKPKYS